MDLITPYKYYSSCTENDGTPMVNIVDDNGLWVFDCFECDYIEILKRINSHDELKQQLAESQARVERLDNCLFGLYLTSKQYCPEDDLAFRKNLFDASTLNNETPKQSLAHIKAEAVEDYGKAIVGWVHGNPIPKPEKYANQLREGE